VPRATWQSKRFGNSVTQPLTASPEPNMIPNEIVIGCAAHHICFRLGGRLCRDALHAGRVRKRWMRSAPKPWLPNSRRSSSSAGMKSPIKQKNIAEANFTERMAIDCPVPMPTSLFMCERSRLAQEHGLDYVEFVNHDGVSFRRRSFQLMSAIRTTG